MNRLDAFPRNCSDCRPMMASSGNSVDIRPGCTKTKLQIRNGWASFWRYRRCGIELPNIPSM